LPAIRRIGYHLTRPIPGETQQGVVNGMAEPDLAGYILV
jgi:hypothetical protein